jgi:sec-independent protein translocase protein TatB
MFGLSFSEILVILVVAVLAVGPNELPRLIRSVGRFVRGISSLGQEIRRQMDEMIGDDELEELKRLRESIRDQRHFILDQQGEYQEVFDISDLLPERVGAVDDETAQAVPALAKEPSHDT